MSAINMMMPDGTWWPVDGDGLPIDTTAMYDLDGNKVGIWSILYFGESKAREVEVMFDPEKYDDFDAVNPNRLHRWKEAEA